MYKHRVNPNRLYVVQRYNSFMQYLLLTVLKGIYMKYKGYTIIQKPEGFAIVDAKFNQEIKCRSVQACKVRISKLIETRIKFNI